MSTACQNGIVDVTKLKLLRWKVILGYLAELRLLQGSLWYEGRISKAMAMEAEFGVICFEDEGRVHKPRKAGGLWELGKNQDTYSSLESSVGNA